MSELRNFLLLQYPQALGTAIHATPLIPALHAAIPGARVVAAASGFALEVLRGNPGLTRLVATPSPLLDLPGAVRALRAAKIFAGEPCAVLQTLGNERTRITVAVMLSGVHTRVGFTVVPQLSTHPLAFDPRLSQIENNLRIVEALGHALPSSPNPELLEPRVFVTEEHVARAKELLREQGINDAQPMAVFITQTSPTQRKSWRAERFREVAAWLHREHSMQIVFVGTAAEATAIDNLRAGLAFPTASLAGRTNVPELAAVLSLADIALTLDTGPMHLARGVNVPMVIVAPAWSRPIEWLPLGNPRFRILKNADMQLAPNDYVIDEVSVEEVQNSLSDLLKLYSPRCAR